MFLIDRYVWASMFADPNEIFYADMERDPRWVEIKKRTEEIKLNPDGTIVRSAEYWYRSI
jgi:hypothetical protein